MAKGRSTERGLVNGLYRPEIADIMERFSDSHFQLQVMRDLAVARYKLYDAAGMWLTGTVDRPQTNDEARIAAQAYLDESLAPAYFGRLRLNVQPAASGLPLKIPNYARKAFAEFPDAEQLAAVAEFHRQSLRRDDWLYFLKGGRHFAAENETGGYTLMLAEDY